MTGPADVTGPEDVPERPGAMYAAVRNALRDTARGAGATESGEIADALSHIAGDAPTDVARDDGAVAGSDAEPGEPA